MSSNSFMILAPIKQDKKQISTAENKVVNETQPDQVNAETEDSNWIVQSSTKARRLVPQFSLTKQDLGTERNVSKEIVQKKKGEMKQSINRSLL